MWQITNVPISTSHKVGQGCTPGVAWRNLISHVLRLAKVPQKYSAFLPQGQKCNEQINNYKVTFSKILNHMSKFFLGQRNFDQYVEDGGNVLKNDLS